MASAFLETFRREAGARRDHDIPVVPLTLMAGSVASVSVWATMALYQSATGQSPGLAAVVMTPAVAYPVSGLVVGAGWACAKAVDALRTLKKARQAAPPQAGPQPRP